MQDAIKKITQKELPDFYNILLERPRDDPDGYDALFVDAAFMGAFASRMSHSCTPNCQVGQWLVPGVVACAARPSAGRMGALQPCGCAVAVLCASVYCFISGHKSMLHIACTAYYINHLHWKIRHCPHRVSPSLLVHCTCQAIVVSCGGKLTVALYTIRAVAPGEELTFDYSSVTESEEEFKQAFCMCSTRACRGSYLYYTGSKAYMQVGGCRQQWVHAGAWVRLPAHGQVLRMSRVLASGCLATSDGQV